MAERMLPIGTIVKLKKEDNNFIIVGYDPQGSPNPEHIYDYSGFIHPVGFSGKYQVHQFDKEQIEEIIALGYQDKEQMEFMKNYMEKRVPRKG